MIRFRAVVGVSGNLVQRQVHSVRNLGSNQWSGIRHLATFSHLSNQQHLRSNHHGLSSSTRGFAAMADNDLKKRLDAFQDLFVEARLSIEDCTDSAGTKYFDEEAEAAQEAVDEAVGAFKTLIADIDDDDQKNSVLRGNGLKVEQLKGELQMALHGGHDH